MFKAASNKSGRLTPSGVCNRTWTLWRNCSNVDLLLWIAEVTTYPHFSVYLSSIRPQHQSSKRHLQAVGVSTAVNFAVARPYSPVYISAQTCLQQCKHLIGSTGNLWLYLIGVGCRCKDARTASHQLFWCVILNVLCRIPEDPAVRDSEAVESGHSERLPYAKIASPMEVRSSMRAHMLTALSADNVHAAMSTTVVMLLDSQ